MSHKKLLLWGFLRQSYGTVNILLFVCLWRLFLCPRNSFLYGLYIPPFSARLHSPLSLYHLKNDEDFYEFLVVFWTLHSVIKPNHRLRYRGMTSLCWGNDRELRSNQSLSFQNSVMSLMRTRSAAMSKDMLKDIKSLDTRWRQQLL
jgi:hypothetical protein